MWYEDYTERHKEPYSLYFAEKILKNYYPKKGFVEVQKNFSEDLKSNQYKEGNYFFIGQNYYTSSASTDSLLQFVAKGNTAFIASKNLPYHLLFKLFKGNTYCGEEDYTGEEAIFSYRSTVNLLHPNLALKVGNPLYFKGRQIGKKTKHRWNYIPAQYLCEQGLIPVGTLDKNQVNFAYIQHGKGRVYLHTNPEAFLNFFLIEESGKKYFDGVLAHLKDDLIYYDIASRFPKREEWARNNQSFDKTEGPLTYILSQRSLAYSWYLLLSMGLLFMFFRSKRKQRIIPIPVRNENTSLVFIQNISNLYFQQGNNKQLIEKKYIYFFDFIRTKYNMTLREPADFVKKLAQKSGVEESKLTELLVLQKNIKNTTFLSDTTMTKVALLINQFYSNCK